MCSLSLNPIFFWEWIKWFLNKSLSGNYLWWFSLLWNGLNWLTFHQCANVPLNSARSRVQSFSRSTSLFIQPWLLFYQIKNYIKLKQGGLFKGALLYMWAWWAMTSHYKTTRLHNGLYQLVNIHVGGPSHLWFLKWLVLANHTHNWCYNRDHLNVKSEKTKWSWTAANLAFTGWRTLLRIVNRIIVF